MTKVKVNGLPVIPTRSRYVRNYVNAVRTCAALALAHAEAATARTLSRAQLTGGQLGEAERILRGDNA